MSKRGELKRQFWNKFSKYANDRDAENNRDGGKLNFNLLNSGEKRKKGDKRELNPSSFIIEMDAPCKPIYFTIRINTENWEVNGKKNILACKIRFGQGIKRDGESMSKNLYKEKEIKFFEHLKNKNLEAGEYDEEDKEPTIHLTRKVDDVLDIDKRDQYFEWLYTNGLLFKRMFYKYYMEFDKGEA